MQRAWLGFISMKRDTGQRAWSAATGSMFGMIRRGRFVSG
jgi:hypothetical protein